MPPHAGVRLFVYVCVSLHACTRVRACCSQHGAPVNQRALLCCHFCIEKASTSFRERWVSHAETRSRLRTRSPEHKIRTSSKKFSHFLPPPTSFHHIWAAARRYAAKYATVHCSHMLWCLWKHVTFIFFLVDVFSEVNRRTSGSLPEPQRIGPHWQN